MSIPEELIMSHLNMLLTGSEPGAELQHLHIISVAKDAAVGPIGVPDASQLEAIVCAIVPATAPLEVPAYIRQVVAAMGVKQAQEGKTVMFAAAGQEVWTIEPALLDNMARRLQREGRLNEHPDAVEMTIVYGACRDGRRWRGLRYLTGPEADKQRPLETLTGRVRPHETSGIAAAAGILKMVGIA